jgi:hypothetical protein
MKTGCGDRMANPIELLLTCLPQAGSIWAPPHHGESLGLSGKKDYTVGMSRVGSGDRPLESDNPMALVKTQADLVSPTSELARQPLELVDPTSRLASEMELAKRLLGSENQTQLPARRIPGSVSQMSALASPMASANQRSELVSR